MNERIRKLAEQAGLLPKTIGPVVETRHMKKKEQDLEKFAELIVGECVDIVGKVPNGYRDYRNQIEDAMRADCLEAIQEHFGVEE